MIDLATFGPPSPPPSWHALGALGQRRAAQWWEFVARERSIDALLEITACATVTAGARTLAWWSYSDAGLMFEADRIVGHAIQFGFVCGELPLWEQIATATNRPALVAWGLEDEGGLPDLWSARVPLDELVRDAAASHSSTGAPPNAAGRARLPR